MSQPQMSIIRLFSFILLLTTGLLLAGFSFAQERPSNRPEPFTDADVGLDVRLVIDVSGSMKRNDPNNLRQPSIDLLLQLLPDEGKAGVWTFGKWVNMLVRHGDISETWRQSAKSKVGDINSVGLFTNIGEALEKAAYDSATTSADVEKNIILLTDGVVDIAKDPETNKKEWRRIVDEVLPILKAAGYRIHTIALSDNADRDLLNKLSLATDGVSDVARSADDLMKIFLKAFDAAVPSEQVPIANNAFYIDSSVEEFTALIFRKNTDDQTEIIGPDEAVYSEKVNNPDINWYRTDQYDLITVLRPLEGEWGVKSEMDPESRITVVSNLNLRVSALPSNILLGAAPEFSLLLQEDGKTIRDPAFLGLMDIKAELEGGVSDNAMHKLWDESLSSQDIPRDGIYRGQLPKLEKAGLYNFSVSVDGKTFKREFHRQLSVRQAFSAEIRESFIDGKTSYILNVFANQADINYDNTLVVASIQNPDKHSLVKPLISSGLDSWRIDIDPYVEGLYLVDIHVKGESRSGDQFDYDLKPLEFNFSLQGGVVEEEEPFVEPTPEPTPEAKAPVEDSKPDMKVVQPAPVPEETGLPMWMIYSALGLGNLILFSLGFFAYKKIMKKDDLISELDAEIEAASADKPAEVAEPEASPEEDDEAEPPMEDLDPDSVAEEVTPDEAPPEEVDMSGEPSFSFNEESSDDDSAADDNGMDDLDEMAAEQFEAAEASSADDVEEDDALKNVDDDDDDMVEAMLKAQGLDLAEEELDDAISSLIDDLEDDDDEER